MNSDFELLETHPTNDETLERENDTAPPFSRTYKVGLDLGHNHNVLRT